MKNRNKRSHNTEDGMPQAFMKSRSELVKGSHKRPYVTLPRCLLTTRIALNNLQVIAMTFQGVSDRLLTISKQSQRGLIRKQRPMLNFKATDTSAGQCVNGHLAGKLGSKLWLSRKYFRGSPLKRLCGLKSNVFH